MIDSGLSTQGLRNFVTAKIHRAMITDANVHYRGSITLCPELMRVAGIAKFEGVHVNCVDTGQHWETYAVPGKLGECVLNGPPANLFHKGQLVVLNRFELLPAQALQTVQQRVVHVDRDNKITEVKTLT